MPAGENPARGGTDAIAFRLARLDYPGSMGSVRLFAIAIGEVRDFFGAPPELAARLRHIAARTATTARVPSQGLLGKLGPVFLRQPGAPIIRPDQPTRAVLDRMLAGSHVPPESLAAAWTLLGSWLAAESWGEHSAAFDAHTVAALDFDLARVGVPTRWSLGELVRNDLGLPLRPAPGVAAGYVPNAAASALTANWRPVVADLASEHQPFVRGLLDWLDAFPEWTRQASAAGRMPPDLVAILHS